MPYIDVYVLFFARKGNWDYFYFVKMFLIMMADRYIRKQQEASIINCGLLYLQIQGLSVCGDPVEETRHPCVNTCICTTTKHISCCLFYDKIEYYTIIIIIQI